MSHDDKKKRKKALQLKKNRELQEIFNIFRLRRLEDSRVKKQDESRKAKPVEKSGGEDEKGWGDKVAVVRNRITDRKRTSRERWNRFSGTESAGARGL